MQLDGKRVLITGAGSGIGRALACQGAERGMVIALAGRRPEKLQETLKLLPGAGHFIIPADVTSADNRAILADRLASAWGHLDILVNNAGLVPGGPLGELTNEDLHAALATNLLAPIALARDMLTLMQASKGARIINVGSLLGDIPYPLFATYSASKAGLGGFSIALRRELAPLGIGVTHAAPRATQTEAAKPFETLAEPFEMKFDRPETVARAIWNAAERDADTVYPAGLERLFVFVQRIFPHLVDRSVAKQLSRAQQATHRDTKAGQKPASH